MLVGSYINWSQSQINHVKTSLHRLDAEGMANELGIARQVAQEKINEVREDNRIQNLSSYAGKQISSKKMKARWIKHKVKRKVKGGM